MPVSKDAVFYHIYLPSFYDADGDGVGDLQGAAEKLTLLSSLGFDAIILSQYLQTSDCDDAYAVTDHTLVDPHVGMISDLEDLISKAHELGLKVVLSFPVYAVSDAHGWFLKARAVEGGYNPYKDYFIWEDGRGKNGKSAPKTDKKDLPGAHYFYDESVGKWYLATKLGQPVLNTENPRVRRELLDALRFWSEKGADGFSLLGLSFFGDPDKEKIEGNRGLLTRGNVKLLRECREKEILKEDGMLFSEDGFTEGPIDAFEKNGLVDLFGNVAQLRGNGASNGKEIAENCKKWLKNARSYEELTMIEDGRHSRLLSHLRLASPKLHISAAKSLAALLFTAPGIPCVFQGQEIGMTEGSEKKAHGVSPYQWDNKENAGFSFVRFPRKTPNSDYAYINAASESKDAESVLTFYKKMLLFRRANLPFTLGDVKVYDGKVKEVIAFTRSYQGSTFFIICSLTSKEVNYPVPEEIFVRGGVSVLSDYAVVTRVLHETIGLRPFESRIYKLTSQEDVKLLN